MIDYSNYKTIKQIADEIGVSKQAVFYRIKKPPLSNDLQSFISNDNGTLMVDCDGESLIKQAFNSEGDKTLDDKELSNSDKDPSKVNAYFDSEIVQILKENVAALQKELDVKNKQIEELQNSTRQQLEIKDKQIADLNNRLAESNAALVSAQQTLQAEQALHAGTIQSRLIAETSQAEEVPKQKLWSKLFKRK